MEEGRIEEVSTSRADEIGLRKNMQVKSQKIDGFKQIWKKN